MQDLLAERQRSLDVTEAEAREIAYHYLRVHLNQQVRPGRIEQQPTNGQGEPIWLVELVDRDSGQKHGELRVGVQTGSTYSWQPVA